MRDEEHKIQTGIIKAVEPIPECRWLHANPNGGKRSAVTGARLKAEGVKSAVTGARLKAEGVKRGIPDLFLPFPRRQKYIGWYHGFYIEVKTQKGRQTKEQKEFEKFAVEQGYKYVIVRSTQEGVDEILGYIGIGR